MQLYSAYTKVIKVSNAASLYTSGVFDLNHVDLTVWSPYHIKLACLWLQFGRLNKKISKRFFAFNFKKAFITDWEWKKFWVASYWKETIFELTSANLQSKKKSFANITVEILLPAHRSSIDLTN